MIQRKLQCDGSAEEKPNLAKYFVSAPTSCVVYGPEKNSDIHLDPSRSHQETARPTRPYRPP